ncbi:ATP-binding protein [Sulfurirhabdus autotrophica]|nr:ATP-binding protein [Sulfurirhabdus autotrophica]
MLKKIILIVEDEPFVAGYLRVTLGDLGYAVAGVVDTGEEAVRIAIEQSLDLVLMDVVLAGEMDGIAAAELIHHHSDIPIIFLTAHSDEGFLKRAKITQPFAYLMKPLKESELRLTIELALQRHEMDSRLKTREKLLQGILDSLTEHIAVLDIQGYITMVNAAWVRFASNNGTDLKRTGIGTNYLEICRSASGHSCEGGQQASEGIAGVLDGSLPQFFLEYPCHSPDKKRWFMMNVTPLEGGKGGAVVSHTNITERKLVEVELQLAHVQLQQAHRQLAHTQSQLMQSEKLASVGQLAAGVSHEINNPIGYVYGNIGTFEQYIKDVFQILDAYGEAETSISDEEVIDRLEALKARLDIPFLRIDLQNLIKESKEGIGRVKTIVQNLKDFSDPDAMERWQWVDLNKGLDSTLTLLRRELQGKAEIKKEYGQIPEVECLPSQINQVFMNLLMNAIQAIEKEGAISIGTGVEGGEVWVSISDTGKGVMPEHLNRVFEPFFTTKQEGQGRGLGLSMSYGIVKKHHGSIEVQSEVNKGTTFTIWLPVKHV